MVKVYLKKDENGDWIIVNDDGAGIIGRNLGKKIEDLPGNAFVVQDNSGKAHMVCRTGDNYLAILNDNEIEGKY